MRNWRTTLTALVGGVAVIAAAFGFHASTEVQTAVVTVTVVVIGLLARDASVDGNDRF